MQQVRRKVPGLLAIVLLFGLFIPLAASAATNDNFSDAANISGLPFSSASVDIGAATIEPDEPQVCAYTPKTIWYEFTATTDGVVVADLSGSSITDSSLNVYQANGSGFSGLMFLACATYMGSQATFSVQAGQTYFLQAGSMYSDGTLQLNLQSVAPPVNDNFSAATSISTLPFSEAMDSSGATLQPGEPTPACAGDSLRGSTWYAFTAAATGPVSVSLSASFQPSIAVYAGSSLTELTELGCQSWGPFTFQAHQGVTYYVQLGNLYGPGGPMQLTLDVTPAPFANFYFYPSDPSIYDTIQFYDASYDPGQIGFQPPAWDLGDGSIASDCCPRQRYADDNDYTVKLSVTTHDGRTASTSQVVRVRSHDVAITKFSAPKSANAGQTRQLSVGINSKRYPDNVLVQLLKSVPGGFETVGALTQLVPVRSGNRTTDFNFSYTFTPADAVMGKVTFKAVAILESYRDVLPADNEAIASPTKVMR